MSDLSVIGGARIGWVNASWPLARLSLSGGRLRLGAFLVGSYDFAAEDVVALETCGAVPGLTTGLVIVHRRKDCPRSMIFWSLRPAALIARIRAAGFEPKAPAEPVMLSNGFGDWMPFKWTAVIAIAAIWNVLLLPVMIPFIGQRQPDPRHFAYLGLAPLLLLAIALGIKYSPSVQHAVMREGRSVGEILPALNLLIFLAGMMSVVFVCVMIGMNVVL